MGKTARIASIAVSAVFISTSLFTGIAFADENAAATGNTAITAPSSRAEELKALREERQEAIKEMQEKRNEIIKGLREKKEALKTIKDVKDEIRSKYNSLLQDKMKQLEAARKRTLNREANAGEETGIRNELKIINDKINSEIKERMRELMRKREELKLRVTKEKDLDIKTDEEDELEDEISAEMDGDASVSESVYSERRANGLRRIIFRLEQNLQDANEKQLLKLALAYKTIGNYEKAIEIANRVLNNNPDSQKALVILANTYRQMKQYDKAIEIVKNLLAKFPHSRVKAFLGILYRENGRLDEARDALEEAVKDSHKTKEFYKELGRIYNRLGQKGYKVFVNGKRPVFDVPPVAMNDRLLVPLRAIVEALGATVTYNPTDKSITMVKGDTTIVMWIGSTRAMVNGNEATLDVMPVVMNERTLVPVRFISENFNTNVEYDTETQMVTVDSKNAADAEEAEANAEDAEADEGDIE